MLLRTDGAVMMSATSRHCTETSAGFWLRGSMTPCRLRLRKFDYEMVRSEIYLNKYVVSIAPFSTPACPDCSQNITLTLKNCSFLHVFVFLIFHPFFQGAADPICPYVRAPVYTALPVLFIAVLLYCRCDTIAHRGLDCTLYV